MCCVSGALLTSSSSVVRASIRSLAIGSAFGAYVPAVSGSSGMPFGFKRSASSESPQFRGHPFLYGRMVAHSESVAGRAINASPTGSWDGVIVVFAIWALDWLYVDIVGQGGRSSRNFFLASVGGARNSRCSANTRKKRRQGIPGEPYSLLSLAPRCQAARRAVSECA